jgi:hypothetical protein
MFIQSCAKHAELPEDELENRDTLFFETFKNLDTTVWKIVNNYEAGWYSGGSDVTGIIKHQVVSADEDNCLCIYSKKRKNITTAPFNSYAYFDLTGLNSNNTLEIEFAMNLNTYNFRFLVQNISQNDTLLEKSFYHVETLFIDSLEYCSYKESDTIRFRFDNYPDSYAGYTSYIDDIKVIEISHK